MNVHPFVTGLMRSPDYFLQNLDLVNRRALVVHVDEATYRRAAFLDERMFAADTQGAWMPLARVLEAADSVISKAPHFIFHAGHCGSTLISRLLGELPQVFTLREPLAFLALAMEQRELGNPTAHVDKQQWDILFKAVLALLTRTYREADTPLIKSTSAATNLVEAVLARDAASRAILLYVDLETYLATMLRAEATRESVRSYAAAWLADLCRLTGRTDIHLHQLGDAQQAAVNWAACLLHFHRASATHPERTHLLNFDDFLRSPTEKLINVAEHFRLQASTQRIEELLSGPLLSSYSKIPSQPFNPEQRNQELQTAQQQFKDEIHSGMQWAKTLCRETPELEPVSSYMHNSIQTT